MIVGHDFPEGRDRCVHCGTLKAHHEQVPQPCVPRWDGVAPRPEPVLRQMAVDDVETINARMAELAKERETILNTPEEPAADPPAVDPGDCCYWPGDYPLDSTWTDPA